MLVTGIFKITFASFIFSASSWSLMRNTPTEDAVSHYLNKVFFPNTEYFVLATTEALDNEYVDTGSLIKDYKKTYSCVNDQIVGGIFADCEVIKPIINEQHSVKISAMSNESNAKTETLAAFSNLKQQGSFYKITITKQFAKSLQESTTKIFRLQNNTHNGKIFAKFKAILLVCKNINEQGTNNEYNYSFNFWEPENLFAALQYQNRTFREDLAQASSMQVVPDDALVLGEKTHAADWVFRLEKNIYGPSYPIKIYKITDQSETIKSPLNIKFIQNQTEVLEATWTDSTVVDQQSQKTTKEQILFKKYGFYLAQIEGDRLFNEQISKKMFDDQNKGYTRVFLSNKKSIFDHSTTWHMKSFAIMTPDKKSLIWLF